MKRVLLALSLIFAALPALAGPLQCPHEQPQSASLTCADGMVWDEKAAACVAVIG